jgi:hypothetical protein
MAHYAFIDPDTRQVVEVIVGVDENETVNGITGDGWEALYAQQRPGLWCRRTSYNGNIRGEFAGPRMLYDPEADVFFHPPELNADSEPAHSDLDEVIEALGFDRSELEAELDADEA